MAKALAPFFDLILLGVSDNLLALDKADAEADDEIAGAENQQVFGDKGDLVRNEHETADVSNHDQDCLENVEDGVLARLELGQEQWTDHQ